MRPLRQRICIVFWVIWLLFSLAVVTTLAMPFITAKPEVFPRPGAPAEATAVIIPRTVVEAYSEGKMNPEQRHAFEADVRNGVVTVPPGTRVTFLPRYPTMENTVSNLFAFLLLPGLFIAILQYLLVGFASPARLFHGKGSQL